MCIILAIILMFITIVHQIDNIIKTDDIIEVGLHSVVILICIVAIFINVINLSELLSPITSIVIN